MSELSSSVSGVIENEVLELPSFSLLAKPTYDAYKIFLNEFKKKYSITTEKIQADDFSDERIAAFLMSYHAAKYAPRMCMFFC